MVYLNQLGFKATLYLHRREQQPAAQPFVVQRRPETGRAQEII